MMPSVSSHETTRRIVVRSAVDVCAAVDDLPCEAIGELTMVADGVVRGAVFVERGRVCWAAARGLAARLTELLVAPSGLDAVTMEDLFRRCRLESKPIGEYLVEQGVIAPAQLRAALLQHTVESLSALCDGAGWATFRARPGGYNPRFSFATSELVVRSCALAYGNGGEPLDRARVLPISYSGEWGARYLRVEGMAAPVPVALVGDIPDRARTVLAVGAWSASALDLASTFRGSDATVTTTEDGGATFSTWRSKGALFAVRLVENGAARVLHHRAAIRRRDATRA